ncbi:hypothetical protein B566_EDAN010937 [Ephemera danica]|nr:hypothetical protein B566_EDAN010937 [Ephemera danica]
MEATAGGELGSPVERVWKPNLYKLQQESPRPQPVLCTHLTDSPLTRTYGAEFHAAISHAEAARLLLKDGAYLVRTSGNGQATHYRLFRDARDGSHYVKEKRFSSVRDLVADGLVTMYVEREAGGYLEKMYTAPPSHTPGSNNNEGETRRATYDKAHSFKVHTFKGLNCAHNKCAERVPSDCCPELQRGVFGTDLTTLSKAHRSARPFVLDRCIQEIESRGLADAEGLYRVPGFSDHLVHERIPGTLICDSMVATLMRSRKVTAVVVGADRVAANGDTANKIGTYQIAVVARHHHVPFYVAAPLTSIDFTIPSGEHVVIEERPECEMTCIGEQRIAAADGEQAVMGMDVYDNVNVIAGTVADHADTNKMPAHNLATVFAPTLMPALEPPALTLQGGMPGMAAEICALEAMILHHQHIFQ